MEDLAKNLISRIIHGRKAMQKLGIYVHIPFCIKKCRYCDFLSFPVSEEKKKEYVQALLKEIKEEAVHYTDFVVDTVFLGGGTPSVLPEGILEEIVDTLKSSYHFSEDRAPEITVEINPATANRRKLESYHRAGVNRISIGAQSVHDRELAYLGRIHKAKDFFQTYRDAEAVGFTNINVDLMAALPGQSTADYLDNLEQVVKLKPTHISAYSLIIEEGTPFYALYGEKRGGKESADIPLLPSEEKWGGKESTDILPLLSEEEWDEKESADILPLPSEEEEREMYECTDALLRENGYHRYEISNYALAGRECQHNIGYWKRKDYVGFGLGAASMVNNVRWKNLSNMEEYIRRILVGNESIREEINRLSRQEQMEEFMFLGLRLTKGVGRKEFRETFGRDIEEVYGSVMEKLRKQGLLEAGEYISLTPYGRDVSNYAMAEFLF